MATSSSFSSVVSSLVRASLGSTLSASVSDADLDRHVRELILKEAKDKEEKYLGSAGIRAYVPEPEPTAKPKPNKRFLNAIIRDVDQHNAVVIQSQTQAAAIAKEKEEAEQRRLRRARADEATADRMRRLMGGALRRDDWRGRGVESRHEGSSIRSRYDEPGPSSQSRRERDERRRDRSRSRSPDARTEGKDKGKRRARDEPETDENDRKRHSSRKSDDRHRRHSDEEDGEERERRRSRRRSRSRSPDSDTSSRRKRSRHEEERPRRSASPRRRTRQDHSRSDSQDGRGSRSSPHNDDRSHSSPARSRQDTPLDGDTRGNTKRVHPLSESYVPEADERRGSSSPRQQPGRSPAPMASKMDKYFDPAYNPILDVPDPSTSLHELVPEGGFEHWNAMLELVKLRKEDKAEKKRKEKEDGGKKKKRKGRDEEDEEEERKRRIKLGIETPGLMDIKYAKRGAMREWDVGKEVT